MSGPRLIQDYLASLSAQLPAQIVEELADGLDRDLPVLSPAGPGA